MSVVTDNTGSSTMRWVIYACQVLPPPQAFYLVNSCICITSHSTHVGTGPRAPGILISRAHHENPYCSRHDPELCAWSFSSTSCDLFPESPSRLPVFYSPHPLPPGPFSALGLPPFLAYYDSSILRVQTCRPQKCFWLADKWDGGAQLIIPQTF